MGNQSAYNPSDMTGLSAHPENARAGKKAKLYGGPKAEPEFTGEIPSPDQLPDVAATEVREEMQQQDQLIQPRGIREGGSGGGQG